MKKNLFFLAAATLALASCSNEDVIDLNNGNAIDFRVASTRGEETTVNNIGQFAVTAIDGTNNYFTNEIFTFNSATNNFTSPSEYYWPGNRSLTFYAYSYYTGKNGSAMNAIDESKLGTISINANGQTITGFSPQAEVADQIDFVSAVASGDRVNNETSGVLLNFNHNLIQAEVHAKTTNKSYNFEIAGIKFGNIASKGDFTFGAAGGNGSWDLSKYTDKTDYTIEYAAGQSITLNPDATVANLSYAAGVNNMYMMVLPQNLEGCDMKTEKENITEHAYIAVKLRITTKTTGALVFPNPADNVQYGWAYIPVTAEWLMGNRYVYTLDFSKGAGYDENGDPILGDPITFTAEVKGWANVTEGGNKDMYVK